MTATKFITHLLEGVGVEQRSTDGYVNATKLSKAYLAKSGKRRDISEWLSNKDTKEVLESVSGLTGYPVERLVITIKTGPNEHRGTYIHPDLVPSFTSWLEAGGRKRPSDAIYLIQADGTSIFKIGIATDPSDRLSHMQVGSPLRLNMVRVAYRSDARDVERRLHEQLDEYRTHGEWFSLPAPDVIALFASETGAADLVMWQAFGKEITGHDPTVRRGMFSATQVESLHHAKGGKRTIAEWVADEMTACKLDALQERYGIPSADLITEPSPDVYIHPRLYLGLLCWIDDDFGLAVEDFIAGIEQATGRSLF